MPKWLAARATKKRASLSSPGRTHCGDKPERLPAKEEAQCLAATVAAAAADLWATRAKTLVQNVTVPSGDAFLTREAPPTGRALSAKRALPSPESIATNAPAVRRDFTNPELHHARAAACARAAAEGTHASAWASHVAAAISRKAAKP